MSPPTSSPTIASGSRRTTRRSSTCWPRHGWIPSDLSETLKRVVGFRNIVVHGYGDLDLDIVRDVAEHRVDDLLELVTQIRARLDARTNEA